MKRVLGGTLLVLAITMIAQAAHARPWNARPVSERGTFLVGFDVLSDGRSVVLFQQLLRRRSRLLLRVGGRRPRVLDVGRGEFRDGEVQHSRENRLLVTWRRMKHPERVFQAFSWTREGGKQRLGLLPSGTRHLEADLAFDGNAVATLHTRQAVFAARRAPRERFRAVEQLGPVGESTGSSNVAVAQGGRAVVAWRHGHDLFLREGRPGHPFGATRTAALRPPPTGLAFAPTSVRVAMTADARAVIAVSSTALNLGPRGGTASWVEGLDWDDRAAGPSSPRVLSRERYVGDADLLVQGTKAVIAWTELNLATRTRWLHVADWSAQGPGAVRSYRTRNLDNHVILSQGPRGTTDVFYLVEGGRWFTVRLGTDGLFRDTTLVTPPDYYVGDLLVAAANGRATTAWTMGSRDREANYRVWLARP